jgi:hypothetical protein
MGLKIGAKAFNVTIAAFAAASLAFAIFAMPRESFEQLIAATGLPSVVSWAEAPLGSKARFIAMFGGGAAGFLLVWLLLAFIDGLAKIANAPPVADDFFDLEFEPPRIRRADAHPDAPSRHPIRAGREFGEPTEDLESLAAARAAGAAEDLPTELPAFLAAEAGTKAEIAMVDNQAVEGEPDAVEPPVDAGEKVTAEIEAEPEPLELAGFEEDIEPVESNGEVVPFPDHDEHAAAIEAEAKAVETVDSIMDPEIPAPFAEPVDHFVAAEAEPPVAVERHEIQPHESDDQQEGIGQEIPVARIVPAENPGESISSLLQRLDTGFSEAEWPVPGDPPLRQLDDRLRTALDELQKMASRNGN